MRNGCETLQLANFFSFANFFILTMSKHDPQNNEMFAVMEGVQTRAGVKWNFSEERRRTMSVSRYMAFDAWIDGNQLPNAHTSAMNRFIMPKEATRRICM